MTPGRIPAHLDDEARLPVLWRSGRQLRVHHQLLRREQPPERATFVKSLSDDCDDCEDCDECDDCYDCYDCDDCDDCNKCDDFEDCDDCYDCDDCDDCEV